MIIIISKKHLLLKSSGLLTNHRLSRSKRRWRAGKLVNEKIPQTMIVHVQTHVRDPVLIVGAIKKHWTSQD
jgi:hypothetical protein